MMHLAGVVSRIVAGLSLGMACACPFGAEQKAHMHGVASLQVAVDAGRVTLLLDTPLENLLGFESAPRTEKQKAAVKLMSERLTRAESLLVLTPGARCMVESSSVEAPVLGMRSAGAAPEKNRSNLPASGAKGHKEKSGKNEGHAELSAQFVFRCADPAKLAGLEAHLFEAFRGMRRLDVQVVGPKGQKSARLTPSQRKVSW